MCWPGQEADLDELGFSVRKPWRADTIGSVTEWRNGPLQDDVLGQLNGDDLGGTIGFTVLLLTTTPDGWPHQAMLSLGEIVIVDPATIRLGLWASSTATENLVSRRRAMLSFVANARSYSIRVRARLIENVVIEGAGRRACFVASVETVGIDMAPYATLESGVRYRLSAPSETLALWQRTRETLANLSTTDV